MSCLEGKDLVTSGNPMGEEAGMGDMHSAETLLRSRTTVSMEELNNLF